MLRFWSEPTIKLDPKLPLREKLRKLNIRHFDELIHDQPKEWLLKNFSKGATDYPINVALLFRNIIWQTRERIMKGEKPPLKELIRTFWYMYIKLTLSRAGALTHETDQYAQLASSEYKGRFKSNIIDTDFYLLQCGKYIELNPVRASMVALPQGYLFSSYNFYAYGKADSLLTPNPAYLALSDSPEARKKQYIDFVIDGSIINSDKLRKQQFIGTHDFIHRLENLYGVKNELGRRGRPKAPEKIETVRPL